jgi:RND family efflux transporter MFP subunit
VKELAGKGSVTQKLAEETLNQFHAAEAAREAATAAVRSAEAEARLAEANAAKAEADRVAAEAHLEVANADLGRATTMADYATIRAPYDGVVTSRRVDTGHFVQPAANAASPLLIVARTSKVRVYIEVPEMEAGGVDVGDPTTIRVQALSGEPLAAPITRTSWSLDPANRSLRAEIDVPNDGGRLRPGMYAAGTIETTRSENALTIPVTAIGRDGGTVYCCVVKNGTAQRRPIELGVRSDPDIEVLKGLSDDSLVVPIRPELLTPDQQVEISETSPK